MAKYICEKCHKPVALSDKFCGYCGSEFINDEGNMVSSEFLQKVSNLAKSKLLWDSLKEVEIEFSRQYTKDAGVRYRLYLYKIDVDKYTGQVILKYTAEFTTGGVTKNWFLTDSELEEFKSLVEECLNKNRVYRKLCEELGEPVIDIEQDHYEQQGGVS